MLPGVIPGAVGQRIADGIVGNGLSVIPGQQIAPGAVTVGVVYSPDRLPQILTGGISILLTGEDVARVIVGSDVGIPLLCKNTNRREVLPPVGLPRSLQMSNVTAMYQPATRLGDQRRCLLVLCIGLFS